MDKIHQALQQLLPQGFAWPRDESSTLQKLLAGMGALLAQTDAVIGTATTEWLPHLTATRLDEWEEALGLPDPCVRSIPQTLEERRSAVILRLRGLAGLYDDSSPAAPGGIAAVCADHGFEADVRYNIPFRCGRDRVGKRLGQLDGKLYILLHGPSAPFRCGDRIGTRLFKRPPGAVTLACYLASAVPARFKPVFIFLDDVGPSFGDVFRVNRNRVGDRLVFGPPSVTA